MRRHLPDRILTDAGQMTGLRCILVANLRMLRFFAWCCRYQQQALAALDCPRSTRIDDRAAEIDGEILRIEMQLRYL